MFFNYFYGSRYPRIIEYRDRYPKSGYPKSGYPETTNPDTNIKSMDPDPDTLNFPDIRIRPKLLCIIALTIQ